MGSSSALSSRANYSEEVGNRNELLQRSGLLAEP